MEDNIYELSKAWKQLDESFTRIDEKKSNIPKKPGSGHIGKQGKAGPHDNKAWAAAKGFKKPKHKGKEIDENAGCGATVAPAINPTNPSDPTNGINARKLGEKKKVCKESFGLPGLGGPAPEVPEVPEIGLGAGGLGAELETEPAVADIIASLQSRYPGAIIEISVTAPDGHRFSDTDIACATEVANASEAPEELGGAWAKVEGEGEEGEEEESDEGTKPLKEAYPPSFGKKDDSAEGETEEEGGEDEGEEEEAPEKPSFGGEKEEGGEDEGGEEEGEIGGCAGITQDCITLSPEGWSDFIAQVDSQVGGEEMGGEEMGGEEGEIEDAGMEEPEAEVDEGVSEPGPGGSGGPDRKWGTKIGTPKPTQKPVPPKKV
jgi:hypothetical protein